MNAIAIPAGPNLVYFTGLHFHVSERPAVLLVSEAQQPIFIFPGFEVEKVEQADISLELYPYGETRKEWGKTFQNAIAAAYQPGNIVMGVEPAAMRFLEMDLIRSSDKTITFTSAGDIIATIRACKDTCEIDHIQEAIKIAENALKRTLPTIQTGVTEKEIANQLVVNLLREGSDPNLPFFPIVASGPNSANPHATPSNRELSTGDVVIIDWGARFEGYISDITRTFAIDNISPELQKIYEIVKKANKNARIIKSKALSGKKIDQAARELIDNAGYGTAFLHRTGHGYGLEAHEPPYIASDNTRSIQPGMTFTIEPGIYLSGIGGVRIEDDIVARKKELETLTTLDRDLIIL